MFEDSLAPRTQYDVHFRIGDVRVRVHPYFWLITLLLGLRDTNRALNLILIDLLVWAAVVFISILAHELGHVLMGRRFGSRGHVILYGFGGLAVGSSNQGQRWQRIAVYLAGPGAGFLLAGAAIGVFWLIFPDITPFVLGVLFHVQVPFPTGADVYIPPPVVLTIFMDLMWINLFWGLINLLPIWPLDGGQVCREICESYRGREGLRISAQISLFTALGFAVLALIELITKKPLIPYLPLGGLFSVLLFGMLAFNSWQLLKFARRVGSDWDEREEEPRQPWEQDADWWKK